MSVPKTRPFKYLKAEVAELIENGTYLLGELLEPKSFTKIVLKKGKLESKTFTIEGRRIPMEEIRARIFKQHKELGKEKAVRLGIRRKANTEK